MWGKKISNMSNWIKWFTAAQVQINMMSTSDPCFIWFIFSWGSFIAGMNIEKNQNMKKSQGRIIIWNTAHKLCWIVSNQDKNVWGLGNSVNFTLIWQDLMLDFKFLLRLEIWTFHLCRNWDYCVGCCIF